MKLFLSPHNDDETLFGAFTLQRERPLVVVVTDSWVQFNRGDGITADQRWDETVRACGVLGAAAVRLGIRDDTITRDDVVRALRAFAGFSTVYLPALQGGHPHHDLVHDAAWRAFPETAEFIEYATYSGRSRSFANGGRVRIEGTERERRLKARAWDCYRSQHPRSGHHFQATTGQPEWYL